MFVFIQLRKSLFLCRPFSTFQISNQIKYIYLSQAKNIENIIFQNIFINMRRGGIDSQGLFNTQPPTGESVFAMMLT